MSSFFKQGGPTPYFTPPALLEEVQQWLDSNGHDAGLALRVIDLHARWFHNRQASRFQPVPSSAPTDAVAKPLT